MAGRKMTPKGQMAFGGGPPITHLPPAMKAMFQPGPPLEFKKKITKRKGRPYRSERALAIVSCCTRHTPPMVSPRAASNSRPPCAFLVARLSLALLHHGCNDDNNESGIAAFVNLFTTEQPEPRGVFITPKETRALRQTAIMKANEEKMEVRRRASPAPSRSHRLSLRCAHAAHHPQSWAL